MEPHASRVHLILHNYYIILKIIFLAMKKLGQNKPGDKAYVGMYKEVHVGTRTTSCFFKASPEKINNSLLDEYGMLLEYTAIYNEDISEQAPAGCSSIVRGDWKKFYKELLDFYSIEKNNL